MFKKEDNPKLALRPRKTHVSSRQIDIIDLFSNNVVSERIRKDPRDAEDKEEAENTNIYNDFNNNANIFETVQEVDSDDDSEMFNVMDEDISECKHMVKYKSGKQMLGSGNQLPSDDKSTDSQLKPEGSQTARSRDKKQKKKKQVEEVVYEEIDEETQR